MHTYISLFQANMAHMKNKREKKHSHKYLKKNTAKALKLKKGLKPDSCFNNKTKCLTILLS